MLARLGATGMWRLQSYIKSLPIWVRVAEDTGTHACSSDGVLASCDKICHWFLICALQHQVSLVK